MIIKQYDVYTCKLNEFSHIDINSIKKSMSIYYIRIFLLYSLRGVTDFIKAISSYSKDGMSFELVEITIDHENDLVYLSESYHTYDNKPTTSAIKNLLEEENFIELCKIGFLDYITMTKENFMHILLAWDKVLNQLPPFVLLYQDGQDWFEILSFDSQKAMEIFVADHTK